MFIYFHFPFCSLASLTTHPSPSSLFFASWLELALYTLVFVVAIPNIILWFLCEKRFFSWFFSPFSSCYFGFFLRLLFRHFFHFIYFFYFIRQTFWQQFGLIFFNSAKWKAKCKRNVSNEHKITKVFEFIFFFR